MRRVTEFARASDDFPYIPEDTMFCEVSLDVLMTDIEQDQQCLWSVLEQCTKPAHKRRVEMCGSELQEAEP